MKRVFVLFAAMLCAAMPLMATGGAESGAAGKAVPKVTVVGPGDVGGMPAKEADFVGRELSKRLAIDFEFVPILADYMQQINVRIAGGNPPDVFVASDKNHLAQIVQQQAALQLDAYLDQVPTIKSKFTADDLMKGKVDGKLYAIAKRPYMRYGSFLARGDWFQALKLEQPKTLEDFSAVLKAFTFQDPDGNGKQDTFGVTGTDGVNSFPPIYGAYGTVARGQWMIKNNQAVYAVTDPGFRNAVAYIKGLVDAGVVDPELMANKGSAASNKCINGQAGMMYGNFWNFYKPEFDTRIKAVNPKASWVLLDTVSGPGGVRSDIGWDVVSTAGRYVFSSALAKKKATLDGALRLFDYVTTEEGQRLVLYGLENVHYKLQDGRAIPIDEKVKEITYLFQLQFTGRDDFPYLMNKYPWSREPLAFVQKLPYTPIYNGLINNPRDMNPSDMYRYEEEQITKFIYGSAPLSGWNAFLDTMYRTYGLQKYVDQANANLKAAGYLK